MNTAAYSISAEITVYEPATEATYPLDATAELAGIPERLIEIYAQHGLISPVTGQVPAEWRFDEDAVHTLRRIEHLRAQCAASIAGIKLILDLMNEAEQLRAALRFRR